jgi:mono/diheme cytochrome c family protein
MRLRGRRDERAIPLFSVEYTLEKSHLVAGGCEQFAHPAPTPDYRGRKQWAVVLASVVAITLMVLCELAPDVPESGALQAAEASAEPAVANEAPGVTVTFSPIGQNRVAGSFVDARLARLVALYVPKGQAPSPFTPAGPFRATFEGDINMRLRNFVVFSAIGRGKLILTVGGRNALDLSGNFAGKPSEKIRLGKGKNHVTVIYESPPDGDSELRVFWSSGKLFPEPLPPMVLTCNVAGPVTASLKAREGRFLFANFRCEKCHSAAKPARGDGDGMPERAMDAPSLDELGARLSPDWMAAWIANPRAMRPDSHMPRLFSDDAAGRASARDAAAYLESLAGKPPESAGPNDATAVAAGGRVYTNLNCVACHTLPDAAPDAQRVSLQYVKAKFLPGQLREFLLRPEKHYAWNPMPDFRLSVSEADDLAAYLLSAAGGKLPAMGPGDAGRGKGIIESAGCLACHQHANQKNAANAISLAEIPKAGWTLGCMATAARERKNAPDFALSDEQRTAIAAFAATGFESLGRDAPAEFAERQFQNLHCAACHARDGMPSLLASTLGNELDDLRTAYPADAGVGETFAPDQRAPFLTWVGEKLRPQWMARFIGGQTPYKPRPYLHARMPGFTAPAGLIAAGFASEHGCAPNLPALAKPDLALAAIGQKLIGKTPNQSFGCVQCHAVAKQPPLTPFEAPAPNFDHVAERLRDDYYFRWVHDPLRIDPESKMPRFDDDDGNTGVTTILNGNAYQQFNAIWQFILEGESMQPPAE